MKVRRAISLTLAILLCLAAATVKTKASDLVYGDFRYSVEASGLSVAIKKYIGAGGDVVIPSEINGLPVTHIDSRSFWRTDVTSVTIPDSVLYIIQEAFWACEYLTTVHIGKNVDMIAMGAFSDCPSLVTINIPEGLTRLGTAAFQNCTSLTEIVVPSSVANYDWGSDYLFKGCTSLQTVHWKTKMSLPTEMFNGCLALRELWVYETSASLTEHAFNSYGAALELPPNLTIYSKPGALANQFAAQYGINFQPFDPENAAESVQPAETASAEPEASYRELQPGDYLGDILYSDIRVFINGYPVPASIMDGRTLVVAEDLRNYGFIVDWDGANMALSVSRNPAPVFAPLPVEANVMPVGSVKCPYVYTNIRTYLSGDEVQCFAIDGRTLIDFEDLTRYGAAVWDGNVRSLRMTLGVHEGDQPPVPLGIEPYDLKWVDGANGIISFLQGITDETAEEMNLLYCVQMFKDGVGQARYYVPAASDNPYVVDVSHMISGPGSYTFTVFMMENGTGDGSPTGQKAMSVPYIR